MKKLLIACVLLMLCSCSNTNKYTLLLPDADSVSNVVFTYNNDKLSVENSENIQNIMTKIGGTGRVTKETGYNETPVNVDDYLIITFNSEKGTTVYVYTRKNKYYIEQPYNGIYKITADEYKAIFDSYNKLK